jgi:hypothetical protein
LERALDTALTGSAAGGGIVRGRGRCLPEPLLLIASSSVLCAAYMRSRSPTECCREAHTLVAAMQLPAQIALQISALESNQ